jgi:UDP-2,4-diacetamido-2,4,6-trideoxy-beta-L-altropyranose hydrolase
MSATIGTGHLMRCLTLADALALAGARCYFLTRDLGVDPLSLVMQRGHSVHVLPTCQPADGRQSDSEPQPPHADWLGTTPAQDATACRDALASVGLVDWLVVDHYALDATWESLMRPLARRLMVIDDLCDRPHLCDVLLDQTLGRKPDDYRPWVPADCMRLCGSDYALLRPAFHSLRPRSLVRRVQPRLEHVLVFMGGTDVNNHTAAVLDALEDSALPAQCRISVVLGAGAPHIESVGRQIAKSSRPASLQVNVHCMATLMADCDLAIGAAGSTSWERCCLGLPTVLLVAAGNQSASAAALSEARAACLVEQPALIGSRLPDIIQMFVQSPDALSDMSRHASALVDGLGTARVCKSLWPEECRFAG